MEVLWAEETGANLSLFLRQPRKAGSFPCVHSVVEVRVSIGHPVLWSQLSEGFDDHLCNAYNSKFQKTVRQSVSVQITKIHSGLSALRISILVNIQFTHSSSVYWLPNYAPETFLGACDISLKKTKM